MILYEARRTMGEQPFPVMAQRGEPRIHQQLVSVRVMTYDPRRNPNGNVVYGA